MLHKWGCARQKFHLSLSSLLFFVNTAYDNNPKTAFNVLVAKLAAPEMENLLGGFCVSESKRQDLHKQGPRHLPLYSATLSRYGRFLTE